MGRSARDRAQATAGCPLRCDQHQASSPRNLTFPAQPVLLNNGERRSRQKDVAFIVRWMLTRTPWANSVGQQPKTLPSLAPSQAQSRGRDSVRLNMRGMQASALRKPSCRHGARPTRLKSDSTHPSWSANLGAGRFRPASGSPSQVFPKAHAHAGRRAPSPPPNAAARA